MRSRFIFNSTSVYIWPFIAEITQRVIILTCDEKRVAIIFQLGSFKSGQNPYGIFSLLYEDNSETLFTVSGYFHMSLQFYFFLFMSYLIFYVYLNIYLPIIYPLYGYKFEIRKISFTNVSILSLSTPSLQTKDGRPSLFF